MTTKVNKILASFLAIVLASFLAIVLAHALFYWKYFWGDLAFGSDVVLQNYPLRVLTQNLAYQLGSIPWWNPFAFSGLPLCGTFASLCFYPVSRATFFLPPWLAINLLIVLHSLMGSLSAFLFFHRLRFHGIAALMGGLAWTFGSFMMQRLSAGHLDALATIHWSPVIALGWLLFFQTARLPWLIFSGVSLALQILAGYPQYVYLFHVVAVPMLLIFVSDRKRTARFFALYLVLGLALSAIQWVPALSILQQSVRDGVRDEAFYLAYAVTFKDLASLWVPHFFGDGVSLPYRLQPYGWETTLYVGLPALYLALQSQLSRRAWLWTFFGFFLFLSMGANAGPVYSWVTKVIPLASWFRVPGRYLFSAFIPFVVLLVSGAHAWLVAERRTPLLAPLALGLGAWIPLTLLTPAPAIFAFSMIVFLFLLLAPSFAPKGFRASLPAILLLLFFTELWGVNARFVRTTSLRRFADLSFSPKEGRFFSMDADLRFQSQSIMHQKYQVAGYDPMIPKDYNRFLNRSIDAPPTANQSVFLSKHFPTMLSHANARWIISDHPLFAPGLPLYGKQGNILVYQNPRALPRFQFVRRLLSAHPDETFEKMHDAPEAFSEIAYSDAIERSETFDAGEKIESIDDRADEIHLTFDPSNGSRFLVIRDNHVPGWKASTEQGPTLLIPVNGFMKGALIPPHATKLWLTYKPVGADLGIGLSAMGGLTALLLLGWRRQPRPDSKRQQVANGS